MATPEEIPSDLALEIEDGLPPDDFVALARNFFGYVQEVAKATGADAAAIEWTVQVREGSAILALNPASGADNSALGHVYARVDNTIRTLAAGSMDAATLIGEAGLNYAKALSAFTAANPARAVKLWVKKTPFTIVPEIAETIQQDWRTDYYDFGTIEGRLEAIQDRGRLQLRIRDPLVKAAINCFVPDNMLELALQSFRHRIEVAGNIHYRKNGVPTRIDAVSIERLPDDDDLPSASDVRGILRVA